MLATTTGTRQIVLASADPTRLLMRQQLTPEQMKTVAAAAETFKAEQQLDDVRRPVLVGRLSGILTDEESDNFRAALARRPLVKGLGAFGNFQATIKQGGHDTKGIPRQWGSRQGDRVHRRPVAPTSR